MRVAMAQITAGTDPAANLELLAERVALAADGGADLVVFPEATMCRFGVPLRGIAQPLDGPWAAGVRDVARQHGIAVVAGMFTPGSDDTANARVRNTVVVADREGALSGYDKIHLYDAFGFAESATVEAGSSALVVDLPLADGTSTRLGVATCYDIRFPELFGVLADAGAEVIAVPTSWGAGPGKVEQWRTLTAARALDSGAYVVAVDQAPPPDGGQQAPTGIGRSRLIDPFGSVVDDEYGESPALGVHTIDPARVATAREALGMRANRRDFAHPGGPTTPSDR
ncbi:putative hydrolase [Gordonia araii NBRC 100433]|uniref:Putative hydrolase n=1 Tax=Gordonia araii NBRC 100433 TaxID=1073574 RepID=G7H711_9ACTN|nr:carbon-nitrogen hydrolase family protein [Gordonia araii]NNG97632.1 carbon-nitrogen hydrolase family protein [Gordonia araii NBRC 100433]GAB11636.1 putative hydrolase [Gordonia araii NBRC 100433]